MVTQAILLRFPRVLKGQCPILAELIRRPFITSQAFFFSVNMNALCEQY